MIDMFVTIAIAALMYLGWATVAVTQERHRETLLGAAATAPTAASLVGARAAGACCLAAGFCVSLLTDGPGLGSILGLLLLGATAIGVAFTLTWRPAALRWIARLAGQ